MARESLSSKQARAKAIVKKLKKAYPDSKCSLFYNSPFQLLIATMLSAQCTDERVNKVVPILFSYLATPEDFLAADIKKIEELIHSTGFYKNKAKNIKACCQVLVDKYQSKLPQTVEELSSLAGVGRKTANVVLGTAFGVPAMVVDTHVSRLSNRMGFCKGSNAVKLEQELMKIIEKKDWVIFTHLIIDHGRAICPARTPKCEECFLTKECPKKEYIK